MSLIKFKELFESTLQESAAQDWKKFKAKNGNNLPDAIEALYSVGIEDYVYFDPSMDWETFTSRLLYVARECGFKMDGDETTDSVSVKKGSKEIDSAWQEDSAGEWIGTAIAVVSACSKMEGIEDDEVYLVIPKNKLKNLKKGL